MLSKAIEMNGTKAIITNTNASVVIKPIKDSYKDGVNFNYLFTYSPIQNGNIVNIDNVNYIVLEKEENLVNTYNKATITKAQIVIYKEQKIFGYIRALKDVVDNNRYFNVLADELELTIPYMENISIGDTVSYNKKNFNVQSIDDTKEGLLVLILKYSTNVGSDGYNNQQKPIVVPVEEKPIEPNPKEEKPSSTTTEEHKGTEEHKEEEKPKEEENVEPSMDLNVSKLHGGESINIKVQPKSAELKVVGENIVTEKVEDGLYKLTAKATKKPNVVKVSLMYKDKEIVKKGILIY
ncbi:hypothetical protein ACV3OY_14790 [Clostridium perfringens]